MASKRRGGFRPPELRGTLGTLLRTTTDVVRDAIERGARSGRARLDDVRAGRRRADALAELGELVLDLIRRGEIDLGELPEARDLVRRLDELDAADEDRDPARGHDDDPDEPLPPTLRRRFDDRASRPGEPAGRRPEPTGRRPEPTGRPAPPRSASRFPAVVPADADDDGTVSSGAASRTYRQPATGRTPDPRPETPSTRAPTKPLKQVGRPGALGHDDLGHDPLGHDDLGHAPLGHDPLGHDVPAPPRAAPAHRHPLTAPGRPGGISFDDEDLADYMHPDDVPAKDPGDADA